MASRTVGSILALFLALHALYNWAIPLGEGPDEPGHLAYVLFLAGEGRLPVQRIAPEPSDVPGEGHQPPLAYALAVPAVAWLPPEQRAILLTANPRFIWAGGDEPGAFMRGSRELWPWKGLTLAWHLTRGVSGLWGAAAVAFTFLAAQRLRPDDPWLAPTAAILVGLNPQLLFGSALVTNDALLAALGTAILWWCIRAEDRKHGTGDRSAYRWAVVAGTLFGLALLAKQSGLLLGPLLLWGAWRAAGGSGRRFAGATLAWGLTALLVAGWWYWRNLTLYGDLFGLGVFKAEFTTQPFEWDDPAAWSGALRQLFGSFWARFGWMSVHPPLWALSLYGLVCLVALVGWGAAGGRALTHRSAAESAEGATASRGAAGGYTLPSGWVGPVIAVAMALAWTLAFAATAGLVAWQGRMLFPAIGAIGLLLAAGLRGEWRRPAAYLQPGVHDRRARLPCCLVPLAFFLALLFLAAYMPLGVIRPAYAWVALAPGRAMAELGSPTVARFAASWEQGVVLRGWRLDGPATPGSELPLTLTWHSLEPVPRPWTVFVHLVAADETIVAQSNRQPHGDTLPFPLWTPGDWMADTHLLPLPAALPPGEYRLRVGLYRPDKDGRRQQVWAADGSALGDYAEVGAIRIGQIEQGSQ